MIREAIPGRSTANGTKGFRKEVGEQAEPGGVPDLEPVRFPPLAEAKLDRYLRRQIFPQLVLPPYGEIEIESLSNEKPVFVFRETEHHAAVVGKLFKRGAVPLREAWPRAEREFANLRRLRALMCATGSAQYVVAPLGTNRELFAMLVTEKAPGQMLDYYIEDAARERQFGQLFQKLSELARFFVKVHRAGHAGRQASPDLSEYYMRALLDRLSKDVLSNHQREAIERYAVRWWSLDGIFSSDEEVIVHGDATPTNFLFHDGDVVGVDLERMMLADRCWDLGFMAAELKHHFLWRLGDRWASEPPIEHFLWQYALQYGDTAMFHSTTRRLPLYMALGLLRIARNVWLGEPYRNELIHEAKRCLKYGL